MVGAQIQNVLYAFIVLLIGLNLVGPFAGYAVAAQANANVTGVSNVMVGLLPFFFVLILVGIGVSYIRFKGK